MHTETIISKSITYHVDQIVGMENTS